MNAQIAYALITHPTAAMRRLRTTGALGSGITMLVAASVSTSVAWAVISAAAAGAVGPLVLAAFALFSTASVFALWLFLGGLTHSAACLMGGYGNFGRFLAAYGLVSAPFTLCAPAIILLSPLGASGTALFFLAVVPLIIVWAWVLAIIGIKEIYGLSAGTATVASLLPCLLVAAVGLLLPFTTIISIGLRLGI